MTAEPTASHPAPAPTGTTLNADPTTTTAAAAAAAPSSTPNGTTKHRAVVCVFCGASPGSDPAHMAAARQLARALHAHDMALVYGGGTAGLMGELARTLVALSGPAAVHGIIPAALVKYERGYDGAAGADVDVDADAVIDAAVFGRTTVVRDMHARKALMAREVVAGGRGGGFVALSGGYGTLEELMEVVTWNQLGIHDRPVVLLNVAGYWDGLVQWVRAAVGGAFVAPGNAGIMRVAASAEEVVECLREYRPAEGRLDLKWDEQ